MTRAGVLLYGPPATGKDTVTDALPSRFVLFRPLKVTPGVVPEHNHMTLVRGERYRQTDGTTLDALEETGRLLWRVERHGSTYATDLDMLNGLVAWGGTPVVHVEQPEAVSAITDGTPDIEWLVLGLWCPRATAAQRLRSRGDTDVDARLAVWDTTPPLRPPHTTIDTEACPAETVAALIDRSSPENHLDPCTKCD